MRQAKLRLLGSCWSTCIAPECCYLARAGARSLMSTVAVMPAERTSPGGTFVDMDPDRDALGQAHPSEDRVDGRHALIVGWAFDTLMARAMLST